MSNITVRKTNIVLSDYSYRKDIQSRLSLSSLTFFEIEVLREILNLTLKFSVGQLAEIMDISQVKLIRILDKLSSTKLFKRDHQFLTIDKEMRKYYQLQIDRFNNDFKPNLEFLQRLLSKVPIYVLPDWYVLSSTYDSIFSSIVEKFFISPKKFRSYLSELKFDDPILKKIIRDIYRAPNFKVAADHLIAKYKLTREKFEKYVLLLEYHFVCCLRYEQVEDRWKEYITPFQEWLDFLLFEANAKPKPILDNIKVKETCSEELWLIKDLSHLIDACSDEKLKITTLKPTNFFNPDYLEKLVEIAENLEFVKKESVNTLVAKEKGLLWLKKSLATRAHELIINMPYPRNLFNPFWTKKNLRVIEKSLRILSTNSWIYQ